MTGTPTRYGALLDTALSDLDIDCAAAAINSSLLPTIKAVRAAVTNCDAIYAALIRVATDNHSHNVIANAISVVTLDAAFANERRNA